MKEMEPWDIAILPILMREGKPVDVEHSSDKEFQTWVAENNIPVDDDGITEWDFDNKIGVINHAIQHGLKPRIVAPFPNYSELFEVVNCSD